MADPFPLASVIVCTRNRSTLLEGACRAILDQQVPGLQWELIIIDNCSTDDTLDVAGRIAAENPDRIRVHQQLELGLSAARNAGLNFARGEMVAFIDDDAYPEPAWLETLVEALGESGVDCVGGPVDPVFQGELPDWFLGRLLPYLSAWDLGVRRRDLTYDEYPRGANIAFRRAALDVVGGFCPDLGRKGASLLSCEEVELCLRIERLGGRIVYEPSMRVAHSVNIERLSKEWMIARFEAQGRSEAIINWRHGGLSSLVLGIKTMKNRLKVAQSERIADLDLIVACHRASLSGYLRGMAPSAARVSRWRCPQGLTPARWSPPY